MIQPLTITTVGALALGTIDAAATPLRFLHGNHRPLALFPQAMEWLPKQLNIPSSTAPQLPLVSQGQWQAPASTTASTMQRRSTFEEEFESLLNSRELAEIDARGLGSLLASLFRGGRVLGKGVKEVANSFDSPPAAQPTATTTPQSRRDVDHDVAELTRFLESREVEELFSLGQEIQRRSEQYAQMEALEHLLGRELTEVERRVMTPERKAAIKDTAINVAPYALPFVLQGFDWVKDKIMGNKDAPQAAPQAVTR
ncbi:hypothetical protein ONZ45_g8999 [Pleurotus djamor]|nr:hypothetical protein ONZ45_g8999 [Pleurotus djamor]